MIIVKLCGGLGNQMFQYAIGRHLSILNRTKLLLDLSPYDLCGHRSYMLENFNICAKIATPADLAKFDSPPFYSKLLQQKYTRLWQKERPFDSTVLEAKGNLYLDGYWQTEKYFAPIKEVISKELSLKREPLIDDDLVSKIRSCTSVAIHIRRGDYVNNDIVKSHHGVLDSQYFQEAVEVVLASQKAPFFFIFSDDKEWVKANLKLSVNHTFVECHSASSDLAEFFLMSNCKHFIIANSTYSWWAAWLSNSSSKVVVAPEPWFASLAKNDIVPNSWHKLQVKYS